MKKSQVLLSFCVVAILSFTSCKTAQKLPVSTNNDTATTAQQVLSHMKALPIELLNGEWLFTQALGKKVVGDEPVRIIFDTQSHRVYGNNGCNTFNGTLIMEKNCTMSFGNCITTTVACRPEVTDGNVMQAIATTHYYNVVERYNNAIVIELLDSKGSRVALIERQIRELLNGMWEIVEVGGKKVRLEEKPSMVLDIESCKLTGNSGCNIMNGEIEYDDTTINNAIRFTGIASTRRMCTPKAMEVEDAVLDAINKIDAFRILDNNRVGLYDAPSDQNLIVLKRK